MVRHPTVPRPRGLKRAISKVNSPTAQTRLKQNLVRKQRVRPKK